MDNLIRIRKMIEADIFQIPSELLPLPWRTRRFSVAKSDP